MSTQILTTVFMSVMVLMVNNTLLIKWSVSIIIQNIVHIYEESKHISFNMTFSICCSKNAIIKFTIYFTWCMCSSGQMLDKVISKNYCFIVLNWVGSNKFLFTTKINVKFWYDVLHLNACTKSGSLQFSQFSGCWLILSVYILMNFDFPFVRLFGVR